MNAASRMESAALPLPLARQVEAAYQRFESAWRAGQRPLIEDHLGGLPVSARAVLLPELLWNVTLFTRLVTGIRVSGLADYMFDTRIPKWISALSLFHVVLPVLMLWMLHRLGYDPRALPAQTALAWVILPLTYAVTKPEDNINWVYGPGARPQRQISPPLYLAFVLIFFPLIVYVPTHLLLLAALGGE